ncbi:MAG: microcyclamide/patellamide family RiPP [Okeania sp. SIO3I5]|nr:microcyclamide/patellamide family RiPP [Okeania sp. SIO3I5]
MGKKNIKPSINQPVIRTNVAKPALEGLTEENLTTTTAHHAVVGVAPKKYDACSFCACSTCSYDGDDAE